VGSSAEMDPGDSFLQIYDYLQNRSTNLHIDPQIPENIWLDIQIPQNIWLASPSEIEISLLLESTNNILLGSMLFVCAFICASKTNKSWSFNLANKRMPFTTKMTYNQDQNLLHPDTGDPGSQQIRTPEKDFQKGVNKDTDTGKTRPKSRMNVYMPETWYQKILPWYLQSMDVDKNQDQNHHQSLKTAFCEKDFQKNKKVEEPDGKRNKDSLGRFSSSCAEEICSINTMKNLSMIVQCIE